MFFDVRTLFSITVILRTSNFCVVVCHGTLLRKTCGEPLKFEQTQQCNVDAVWMLNAHILEERKLTVLLPDTVLPRTHPSLLTHSLTLLSHLQYSKQTKCKEDEARPNSNANNEPTGLPRPRRSRSRNAEPATSPSLHHRIHRQPPTRRNAQNHILPAQG